MESRGEKKQPLEYKIARQNEWKESKSEEKIEGAYIQAMPDGRIMAIYSAILPKNPGKLGLTYKVWSPDEKDSRRVLLQNRLLTDEKTVNHCWFVACASQMLDRPAPKFGDMKGDDGYFCVHLKGVSHCKIHSSLMTERGLNLKSPVLLSTNPVEIAGINSENSHVIHYNIRTQIVTKMTNKENLRSLTMLTEELLAIACADHVEIWKRMPDKKWQCHLPEVFKSESKTIQHVVLLSSEQFAVIESASVTSVNIASLKALTPPKPHGLCLLADYAPLVLADQRTLVSFNDKSLQLFDVDTGITERIDLNCQIAHLSIQPNGILVVLTKTGAIKEIELESACLLNVKEISSITMFPKEVARIVSQYLFVPLVPPAFISLFSMFAQPNNEKSEKNVEKRPELTCSLSNSS